MKAKVPGRREQASVISVSAVIVFGGCGQVSEPAPETQEVPRATQRVESSSAWDDHRPSPQGVTVGWLPAAPGAETLTCRVVSRYPEAMPIELTLVGARPDARLILERQLVRTRCSSTRSFCAHRAASKSTRLEQAPRRAEARGDSNAPSRPERPAVRKDRTP